jgi:hypothetical protein
VPAVLERILVTWLAASFPFRHSFPAGSHILRDCQRLTQTGFQRPCRRGFDPPLGFAPLGFRMNSGS